MKNKNKTNKIRAIKHITKLLQKKCTIQEDHEHDEDQDHDCDVNHDHDQDYDNAMTCPCFLKQR